jgi:hypothetical protein
VGNSYGQEAIDAVAIDKEFSKLLIEYSEKEESLKNKKSELKLLMKSINIHSNKDSLDKLQKLLNETKNDYLELDSLYKKQKTSKEKHIANKFNAKMFENYQFKKHKIPNTQNGIFDDELTQFLEKNLYLNDSVREQNVKVDFHTRDIFNPINFTTLHERMPKSNGIVTTYKILNRSGLDYIKKGSQIHIEFNKEFIENLTLNENLNLQVLAYVERKDKTIKPLSVLGFTMVKDISTQVEKNVKNISIDTLNNTVEYKYVLDFKDSNIKSLSGEVNLAWEDISKDDKIIISVINKASNDVGFSTVLIVDEFGWINEPTGGFGFTQILNSGSNQFNAAGTIGYSFRYKLRPSSSFFRQFITPSFGPELNVQQVNNETSIGVGMFISSMLNTVKFGGGLIVNGVDNGKPYISIGLNFIESYQKITELISKTK